jgi:hypothetical protein
MVENQAGACQIGSKTQSSIEMGIKQIDSMQ